MTAVTRVLADSTRGVDGVEVVGGVTGTTGAEATSHCPGLEIVTETLVELLLLALPLVALPPFVLPEVVALPDDAPWLFWPLTWTLFVFVSLHDVEVVLLMIFVDPGPVLLIILSALAIGAIAIAAAHMTTLVNNFVFIVNKSSFF